PPPAQSAAASLRGFYLRAWRYGRDTESLAAQALEREHWNEAQWAAWREAALAPLLARAVARVPHYRDLWTGRAGSTKRLEDWPVLQKRALRAGPRSFIADDRSPRFLLVKHTSGTTGTPLTLWVGRSDLRRWYALFEARVRRWNGVSRHDRWAILGGQLVTPAERTTPPFWVWNGGLRQLYMSAHHLAPGNIAAYAEALRRHRIVYVLGYASALSSLASMALARGIPMPRLKVVISNAEPLFDAQRRAIALAFDCPVRDTYGMAEVASAGSECEAGAMHLWPEVGVTEVLRDHADEPAPPGTGGRLVATSLLNADMPLIRYDIGDRVTLAPESPSCACGRTLPRLASIEGRCDDVLVTPEGRRIGRLDPLFKGDLPIQEAQIIQEEIGRVRVLVVTASGYGPRDAESISRRLRERMGEGVQVIVEEVAKIPRTSGGKFRAVISLLEGVARADVPDGPV
ncbi:MAG: hypothetical protein ABI968_08745, partial [Acidobacteriota bacterium]